MINRYNAELPLHKITPTAWLLSFAIWCVSITLLFQSDYVQAAPSTIEAKPKHAQVDSLSEIESGRLVFTDDTTTGYYLAPLNSTDVAIAVKGMSARTLVKQTFHNPTSQWIEAIYVFPLPDDATVDQLTMTIADRQIKGIIKTKQTARKIYQRAKNAGRNASLLEQQRPNLFTTKVANIPPNESIEIEIAFQSRIKYVDAEFELNFPLTITPRYIPGLPLDYSDVSVSNNTGWARATSAAPDANEITPPITHQPSSVSIAVTLDTGIPLAEITSASHDILTAEMNEGANTVWQVSLSDSQVPADRDFRLQWIPRLGTAPVAASFREDIAISSTINSFASLMLVPPQQIYNDSVAAREVIFVIDTSSSMGGSAIRQAREALTLGIEKLSTLDRFNVIEFDSTSNSLFRTAVPASSANKSQAINWVKRLAADNGTEILSAMQMALRNQPDDEYLRQVIFITDGSVGNEDQIFRYVKKNLQNTRLFTVGIGSAPNTWFMRKTAEVGRGTYTLIGSSLELTKKMDQLLTRLKRPVLTDVQVTFNTPTQPEIYPTVLQDVYSGEPVLADARWNHALTSGDALVTGKYNGQNWSQRIELQSLKNTEKFEPSYSFGLHKLWANRKIQSLEDQNLISNEYDAIKAQITDVALNYQLVTKYTSLVAVDQTPVRPAASPINTLAVPQAMPAGNTMLLPQGSLGLKFKFLLALLFALLSVIFALATLCQTRQFTPQSSAPCKS